MIQPYTHEILFCEGCPGQKNFTGAIAEESAHLEIEVGKEGRVDWLGDGFNPGDAFVTIRMGFKDVDGGQSYQPVRSVSFEQLAAAGIEVQLGKTGPVKGTERIAASVESRVGELAKPLTARVARCVHASVDTDGKTSCPALSQDVLRKLVDEKFAPIEDPA